MLNVAYPAERRGLKFLLELRKDPLNFFVNLMEKEGDYAGFYLLDKKVVLLNDATAIKHVFADNYKNYRKGRFNDALRPILGDSVFLTEGEIWKKQRQEARPVFSNDLFPEMTENMVAATEEMFARWDKKIERDEPIDINLETMWFALDVVLRALFHQDKKEVAQGIKENLGKMLKEAEGRIWSLVSLPQAWILKLPKYKKSLMFLDGIVADLISERQYKNDYPEDLLSRIIVACGESKIDKKILRDQVMSYLMAGHETTANALAWTWYEIGRRPEVLEKMKSEVMEHAGQDKITYDVVKKLEYTCQIFDEALRVYPPIWTMSREALEDDVLPLDNGDCLAISKGTSIMLSPYAVQRREKYWPHPEAFDPDRFSREEIKIRPKMAYFPFGGGARLCLGFRFAQIEAIVAMSMIVQRYELTLIPGQTIRPEPIITLRPDKEVMFRIKKKKIEFPGLGNVESFETVNGIKEGQCPYHVSVANDASSHKKIAS